MSNGTTTYYAGNYIYEGSALKFFSHPEGYIEPNGSNFDYVYQYKDHLGNIRLAYSDANNNGSVNSSEIKEENNYYPFGLKHKGYNNVVNGTDHPYGYNGIEETEELGLNVLEMDMRQFDPAIARWTAIDPITHFEYSPYQAFDNNPAFWADPSGADSEGIRLQDSDGNWHTISQSAGVRVYTASDEEECPSCETEEDWKAYYSQAENTAAMLGEDAWGYGERLTRSRDEDGHTLFYLDGELQDLRKYDNKAEAIFSVVDVNLFLINTSVSILKYFSFSDDVGRSSKVLGSSVDDFVKMLKPLDDLDSARTLYRGTTGSEKGAATMFLTDNSQVAATYVKNGGSVMSFRISDFAIKKLEMLGNLAQKTGMHGQTGAINTEYMFSGKNLIEALMKIGK
ncbi:RHS repeat domain-containing protein [Winogradskyella haliclonae]|uniref:RHS repeat domain-containing protein n=1 Tax=Winogradskyella haliclonae TaxID=2048558 RepID=UPI00166E1982|nr:RHS repeat-associated core domain-containing protein [Winogradskyella haliclonae]